MGPEKEIEEYLKKLVYKADATALYWKFTSSGTQGVPDRFVCCKGLHFFVELKRPGGKLRALQVKRKEQLNSQGMPVYVIDSKPAADCLMKWIGRGILPDDKHFYSKTLSVQGNPVGAGQA